MKKLLVGSAVMATMVFLFWAFANAQTKQSGMAAAPPGQAELQKTLLANERAVNDAFAKGDLAKVKELIAADSWSIDPMMGPMSTADMLKGFEQMVKDMKMTSWDITDVRMLSVDANTAVMFYKWTGSGTYQGQPIPSPTWASTVWARRGGKWQAVFHQESSAPAAPKK